MSRFVPSPSVVSQLRRLPELQQALGQIAELVRLNIQSLTPVETGALKSSFQTRTEIDADGAVAQVFTDDYPKWRFVEYGTSDTPAAAMMRRGLGLTRGG